MSALSPSLSIVEGDSIPEKPQSLHGLLKRGSRLNPNGTAVESLYQLDNDAKPLSWTHLELEQEASKVAQALKARGIKRDSPLLAILHSSMEYALALRVAATVNIILTSDRSSFCGYRSSYA